MKIEIPQLILLVLIVLELGITIAKHGEPKKGKFDVLVTLISSGILLTILYYGGFFTK